MPLVSSAQTIMYDTGFSPVPVSLSNCTIALCGNITPRLHFTGFGASFSFPVKTPFLKVPVLQLLDSAQDANHPRIAHYYGVVTREPRQRLRVRAGVLNAQSPAQADFAEAVQDSLSAALHVDESLISFYSVTPLPASSLSTNTRRRLQGSAPALAMTGLLNLTAVLHPPYGSKSYPRVFNVFEAYSAKLARKVGYKQMDVRGVLRLTAAGIGGNGVCEIGEMPSPMSRGDDTISMT